MVFYCFTVLWQAGRVGPVEALKTLIHEVWESLEAQPFCRFHCFRNVLSFKHKTTVVTFTWI